MMHDPRTPHAVVAALLTAALAGCGGEPPAEEPPIRPVRTQQVFATGASRVRTFSGTARAGVESRLSFKVAGNLTAVAVEVGDRVRAGDVIARLDPTDFELQMEDAEASVARTEAEERRAAAGYERVRQLYENDNASAKDLEAARAAAESSRAAARSARKNLELAKQRLAYTRLAAPVAGAISEVSAEVSENVGVGQVVAVLSSGARPEVAFNVPELLITRLQEGGAATVALDALPGREFGAIVTEVGVSASGGTTFPVTVRLETNPGDVRPGMAAEVSLRFPGSGVPRVHVPASAIGEDRGGRFAFVVDRVDGELGTVRRREVRVGALTAEGLEVLDGLEDGDLLVTAGVTKIHDGLVVRVPGSTP